MKCIAAVGGKWSMGGRNPVIKLGAPRLAAGGMRPAPYNSRRGWGLPGWRNRRAAAVS